MLRFLRIWGRTVTREPKVRVYRARVRRQCLLLPTPTKKQTGRNPPNPGGGGSSGNPKAIGHKAAAEPLLDKAGIEVDEGVSDVDGFVEAVRKRYCDRKLHVRKLA